MVPQNLVECPHGRIVLKTCFHTAWAVSGRLGSLVSSTIPRPIEESHTDNGFLQFPEKGRVAQAIRKIAEAMSKSQAIKNPVDH